VEAAPPAATAGCSHVPSASRINARSIPERPQHPCREFVCGWLLNLSPLPDWMRPEQSDMIMLAANFFWRGLPVDVAVAAGGRPRKKALDWLMAFSAEHRRLLIYQVKDEWFAFGRPAFQAEISTKISRGEKLGPIDPSRTHMRTVRRASGRDYNFNYRLYFLLLGKPRKYCVILTQYRRPQKYCIQPTTAHFRNNFAANVAMR
jgi:hypothetical protein